MIDGLAREVELVQNPALGAVLVWRFCLGYQNESATASGPPLQLAFLVLPLVLHVDSFENLEGTRAGLRAFVDKFTQASDPGADKAFAIHSRALSWRPSSLAAVRFAVAARLVSIDPSSGRMLSLSESRPSAATGAVRPLIAAAEKLGRWCAPLTPYEIGSILKVAF